MVLLLVENSDKVCFKVVKFEGYQDMFYSKIGSWSYFFDCEISGYVDFIFGLGIMVFDNCNIVVCDWSDIELFYGYIMVLSILMILFYGLIFINSWLIKESGVFVNSFVLGCLWYLIIIFVDGCYVDLVVIG